VKQGYTEMMNIAVSSPRELAEIAEIGEPTAAKIIQAARKKQILVVLRQGPHFLNVVQNRSHYLLDLKHLMN